MENYKRPICNFSGFGKKQLIAEFIFNNFTNKGKIQCKGVVSISSIIDTK